MKVSLWVVASGACLTLCNSARAGVIVVDSAGGGSFVQISQAVAAAQEGDTILVKPGSYMGFSIDGKSLTVVGDVGTRPSIFKQVSVSNIGSTQSVTLARLNVTVTTLPGGSALSLEQCSGPVRCVECDFNGINGTDSVGGGAGVFAWYARNLAISGCSIAGGRGKSGHTCFFDIVSGGAGGISLQQGSLAVHDCIVSGGHGGDGGDYTGEGGGGMDVRAGLDSPPESAFVFASRSNIHGGSGGNTDCPVYGCPGDGGDALRLQSSNAATTAVGWIVDSMFSGGVAGVAQGGSTMCPADPGETYPADQPFLFSASGLGFAIPSVARENDSVTVTFTGVPGSRVFLNDSLTTTFEAVPSWRGVLLSPFPRAAGPMREIKWGVIPASGVLTRTYNVPHLPTGEQAQTRFLQAYRVGPNGITLGSFRTLTVLDSAF